MSPRLPRVALALLVALWPGRAAAQLGAAMEVGAGTAAIGEADLSYFTPYAGPLRLELDGSLFGTMPEGAQLRSTWKSSARVHLHGATRGVWAASSFGGTSAPDVHLPVRSLSAGGWLRFGDLDLHLGVARGVLGDSISQPGQPTVQRDPELASAAADSFIQQRIRTFTDVSAAASWRHARWELGASASHRTVVGGSRTRRNRYHTSWRLDGGYHLSPRLAVVAATGQYAEQLATALPGGRYTTLSLRIAFTKRGVGRAPLSPRGEGAARRLFVAERLDDELVRIAFDAPGARTVELAGDFTDWEPVALTRAGGSRWEVALPLERGIHQVNVRFDGGHWQVPPATTPMADDFGGLVGVFRVD